ncbi:SDR family NAD(P)-dependent oxidoreductase [Parafrankia sp. EUN1f]|uniref:SDR family NAD(P)-dependent oxidoreductase n=1 Tax=Parafrankia sp. EUN1f TaxID=102897 RepID=UPI0001C43DF5|nr:SDR family NAD(P)-dependent oxidoreductase [Parafrankia sp. EUN1f]EFC85763.1 NmrA family protein [Parafrankia sp. EUN1f]
MPIAVTGASGQLGRLVVENLLATGIPAANIIAIVRNTAKVVDFAARGVTVRHADYTDRTAYYSALDGVERLLLISTPGVGATVMRHANVVEAAVAAGVGHIAYTSILHADTSSNPLADEHAATEKLIAATRIPATMLRNAFYTELYTSQIPTYTAVGAVVSATGEGRISAATRADFAAAAAAVLTSDDNESRIYELGGPSFSLAELADEVTAVTGTPVAHRNLSEADFVTDRQAAGMGSGAALFAAAVDASIAAGEMETGSTSLAQLIGRPRHRSPKHSARPPRHLPSPKADSHTWPSGRPGIPAGAAQPLNTIQKEGTMPKGIAVIVGVGPGLGIALARAFSEAGHPVALLARNKERLDQYTSELSALSAHQPVRGYAADAADPDSLRAAINTAINELGAPEVLAYNAALLRPDTPTDRDDAGWANSLAVNVLGAKVAAETVLAALPGHGSLLFTGGGLAYAPNPAYASLSVGKTALRAYVHTLAAELSGTGVHATVVTIDGGIGGGEERFEPSVLAQAYVDLHHQAPEDWRPELMRS